MIQNYMGELWFASEALQYHFDIPRAFSLLNEIIFPEILMTIQYIGHFLISRKTS